MFLNQAYQLWADIAYGKKSSSCSTSSVNRLGEFVFPHFDWRELGQLQVQVWRKMIRTLKAYISTVLCPGYFVDHLKSQGSSTWWFPHLYSANFRCISESHSSYYIISLKCPCGWQISAILCGWSTPVALLHPCGLHGSIPELSMWSMRERWLRLRFMVMLWR